VNDPSLTTIIKQTARYLNLNTKGVWKVAHLTRCTQCWVKELVFVNPVIIFSTHEDTKYWMLKSPGIWRRFDSYAFTDRLCVICQKFSVLINSTVKLWSQTIYSGNKHTKSCYKHLNCITYKHCPYCTSVRNLCVVHTPSFVQHCCRILSSITMTVTRVLNPDAKSFTSCKTIAC
jgi:hypothetical protein